MTEPAETDASRTASPGEWMVGALGAVLVLLTVGFLVREGLSVGGDRAILAVGVQEIVEVEGSWYVEIEVRNSGDIAAAQVLVEGVEAGSETSSTVTLDFVPSRSTRAATLVFGERPTAQSLSLRAVSFVEH